LAGGSAGASTLALTYPLDYARTRLSADVGKGAKDRQFSGLADCLKKSVAADGMKGPYKGVGISMIGCFIYRGFYFGVYDIIKSRIPKSAKKHPIWYRFIKLLASNAAVQTGALAGYPIDTVRRRLAMDVGGKPKYKGVMDCFSKVVKKEGVNGLFTGATANLLRGIGASVVLVLYDDMRKFLGPYIGGDGH